MTITGIDASKLNVSMSAAQLQTLQDLLASTGALPFFTPGNNVISQATAPQDLTLSGKVSGRMIAANISSPKASASINAGLASSLYFDTRRRWHSAYLFSSSVWHSL